MAVVFGQMLAQPIQVETGINTAQQMILGNVIFEIEGVEQPLLTAFPFPHHRSTSIPVCAMHIVPAPRYPVEYFNRIGHNQPPNGLKLGDVERQ
jgi:hypothetical protein